MKMKQQELNDLIDKVNNGSATDEELGLYNHYLNQLTSGEEAWDMQNLGTEESVKNELQNRIELIRKPVGVKKVRLWPRVAEASRLKIGTRRALLASAAAVAVITLGVWLYYTSSLYSSRHAEFSSASPLANDIKPGKNTATLTLSDGSVIDLSDTKTGVIIDASKLFYSDGTAITPSLRGGTTKQSHQDSQNEHDEIGFSARASRAREGLGSIPRNDGKGRPLSVSTPRGGQYQVVLPDGTKVWLNADSKITFPSQFSGKERKVLLEGEAYFAVVHNAKQPFRVESRGQVVEDIGTEFNINAYADEKTVKTTLVEGSASVSSLRGGTTRQSHPAITLQPNQQATLTANSEIQVKQIDPELAVAWKNNQFMFEDEKIENIMKMIERWYNVEVVYEGAVPEDKFGGSVSRFDNVSKVLRILESTGRVHFRIEGRRIMVAK